MLILLSPAKALDFETPPQTKRMTAPFFHDRAEHLIGVLRTKPAPQIAKLMELSENLAQLNVERYHAWQAQPKESLYPKNIKQAILAFDGDVYEGLRAKEMNAADLDFAQEHIRILSGLYGVLRPLDLIQPHRLEMGTKLQQNLKLKTLYQYWRPLLTAHLNKVIAEIRAPAILNLASDEYFSSLDAKGFDVPVIQPVFEEKRPGNEYKVISFMAKKARGLMARQAIINRLSDPQLLKGFTDEGYAFAPTASNSTRWVFRR
jgi:cytoplasmic iron level regulating protein YaaA (DUF328/UPF0246 family)